MLLRRIFNLVNASLIATSAMTGFSYALSAICGKNFSEPELLSQTIDKQVRPDGKSNVKGWIAHYLIGILWALVYETSEKPVLHILPKHGRTPAFGIGSGLVSIAAWRLIMQRHPRSLRTTSRFFFFQLVPAHVVYALVLHVAKTRKSPKAIASSKIV